MSGYANTEIVFYCLICKVTLFSSFFCQKHFSPKYERSSFLKLRTRRVRNNISTCFSFCKKSFQLPHLSLTPEIPWQIHLRKNSWMEVWTTVFQYTVFQYIRWICFNDLLLLTVVRVIDVFGGSSLLPCHLPTFLVAGIYNVPVLYLYLLYLLVNVCVYVGYILKIKILFKWNCC